MSLYLRYAAFLFVFCLLGCGETVKGLASVNLGDEPQSLDPRKVRDLASITVVQNVFEGLMRRNEKGEIEKAIALDVEVSKDRLTYTFTLKESRWSNGEPVTSYDFAYAYKSALDPKFPSPLSYQLYVLKNGKEVKTGLFSPEALGVGTPSSKKLVLRLQAPCPYLMDLLTLPIFFPVFSGIDKDPNWPEKASGFISNGPFYLKSWKHNDEIKLLSSPYYWDKKAVRLTGIKFMMVSPETEFKLFKTKKLDWTGSPLSVIPVDAIFSLGDKLLKTKFYGTVFLRLNLKDSFLSSLETRRALNLAVDRCKLVNCILQGGQLPAKAFVPGNDFSEGEIPLEKFDFSSSRICLVYMINDRNHLVAQALQQMWKTAYGLKVVLEGVERKTYYDRIAKGKYQMALGSWSADFVDPSNFLEVFKYKDGPTNNTFWENENYTVLLDKANSCLDQEKRREFLLQAEKLLLLELPIIPLYHLSMNFMKNENLEGVSLSSLGHMNFKTAFFKEDIK